MRCEIADIVLSSLTIVASVIFLQYFVMNQLAVYAVGSVILILSSSAAVATSSYLLCKGRSSRIATLATTLCTLLGALVVAFATPLQCVQGRCHGRPKSCAGYSGDWADDWHEYPIADDADDDFFRDKCFSDECDYDDDAGDEGLACFSDGYQDCGIVFGSRFETEFAIKSGLWHGFRDQADCDDFFGSRVLVGKMPMLAVAILAMASRIAIILSATASINEASRRLATELISRDSSSSAEAVVVGGEDDDVHNYQLLSQNALVSGFTTS